MKKIIFIFISILCLCASNVQAQYKSFFADSTWRFTMTYYVTCYCSDYSPFNLGGCRYTSSAYYYKSDTIMLDNLTYYHILRGGDFWDNYVREDTVYGRLYRYDPANHKEYLLCDMSLSVGDTFHLFDERRTNVGWSELDEANGDYIVDSAYYINGLKYLELHKTTDNPFPFFNNPKYNISFRFMESIGPIYGLGAIQRSREGELPLLLCVDKNDTLYYMTHEDLQCYQIGAGITTYDDAIMNIYPNPAKDKITVSFENGAAEDGTLYLLDIMGRILWQGKVTDNLQTISVHGYAPGLYTVLYMDSQGRKAKKVLVQ